MRKRLVVIGGVAAGASAAARARRMNEDTEIVLVEAGPYISYANCGLPYFVGGEIDERNRLFVVEPRQFAHRFQLEIRTNTRATALEVSERRVVLTGPDGEVDRLSYDRLILATGSSPVIPALPGIDHPSLFPVRTVPDVDRIAARLDSVRWTGSDPPRALVVGGGYIGLETAEQLRRRGCRVTLVEQLPQLMQALDGEMAELVRRALVAGEIEVRLNEGLVAIREEAGKPVAETSSGKRIPFELGILALGVRPNVELARQAGLRLGVSGAVEVDREQRTSDEAVYAAGDNSETIHLVTGAPVSIPLAGPANKMGRVAGNNAALDLAGARSDDPRRLRFRGVLGTSVVRTFGTIAAVTGLTERTALQSGVPFEVTYLWGKTHAGYYPGAESILMKLLFDPVTGRLLGGQAVGGKGTEKRIDVLATAVAANRTVEDLSDLDLCYAPPVSSAKDVVVTAGFLAVNQLRSVMPAWSPRRLFDEMAKNDDSLCVVDVRTPREFASGAVPGAMNLPLDQLRDRKGELPSGRRIAVYCQGGYRSYLAQRMLLNSGRADVYNVLGGYQLIQIVEEVRKREQRADSPSERMS